jgi:class 3 adenylate cyclase
MQARRRMIKATARQPPEISIGFATGTVVTGCMSSDKRLTYTVLGYHVNLASRLCGIAQQGEIIAAPATVEATGTDISSTTLHPCSSGASRSPCSRITPRPAPAHQPTGCVQAFCR